MDIRSDDIGLDPVTTVKAFWSRVDAFSLPRIEESLARFYLNKAISTIEVNKGRYAAVLSQVSFSLVDLEQADHRNSGFFAGTKEIGWKATDQQKEIGRKNVDALTADDMKVLSSSEWLHVNGAISLIADVVLCEEIRRVNPDFISVRIGNLADVGPTYPRRETRTAPA